jgi:hypothetical protein
MRTTAPEHARAKELCDTLRANRQLAIERAEADSHGDEEANSKTNHGAWNRSSSTRACAAGDDSRGPALHHRNPGRRVLHATAIPPRGDFVAANPCRRIVVNGPVN